MNPVFINVDDFPLTRGIVAVKGELSGGLALHWGEQYFPAAIRPHDEIDKPVAAGAHAVEEDYRFF